MTDLAQRPQPSGRGPGRPLGGVADAGTRFRELAAIAMRSPTTVIGLVLILALVSMAIFAPL